MSAPSVIWSLIRKEVKITLRDKRTLFAVLLFPLLAPFLFAAIGAVAALVGTQVKTDRPEIAVQGTLPAELQKGLGLSVGIASIGPKIIPVTDAKASVESGKYAFAIRVPDSLPQRMGEAAADIEVYVKADNTRARAKQLLIDKAVLSYNKHLLQNYLQQQGVNATMQSPVGVKIQSVGKGFGMIDALSVILPMMLAIWTMVGCQAGAIDASVGERERCTLESLLVAPVSRGSILQGKLLAVALIGLCSGLTGTLGLMLFYGLVKFGIGSFLGTWASALMNQMLQVDLPSFGAILVICLQVMSLASVLSGLVLLPCIFARSFKEAQMYVAPSALIAVMLCLPSNFRLISDVSLGFYAIPVTGSVSVIADAMKDQLHALPIVLAVASNFIAMLVLLWIMHLSFRRESVIFRSA